MAPLRAPLLLSLLAQGSSLALQNGRAPDASAKERVFHGPRHRACHPKAAAAKNAEGQKSKSKIVGGTAITDPSKYPFLTWVGDIDGTGLAQFCGGTLISDRIVLTAAHCIWPTDLENLWVYTRTNLTDYEKESGISRDVVNWVVHPEWDNVTFHNDIALYLLNESVPESIKPVRLADGTQKYENDGRDMMIAGWGSVNTECKQFPYQAQEIKVPSNEDPLDCMLEGAQPLGHGPDFNVSFQTCAGSYNIGIRKYPGCGDDGGPLLVPEEDGSFTQVGLWSFSFGFPHQDLWNFDPFMMPYPDVFTRVSSYRSWIQSASKELIAAGARPWPEEEDESYRKKGIEYDQKL